MLAPSAPWSSAADFDLREARDQAARAAVRPARPAGRRGSVRHRRAAGRSGTAPGARCARRRSTADTDRPAPRARAAFPAPGPDARRPHAATSGTASGIIRVAVASTTPPSSIGATLSPWRLPLDTDSPSSANGYSASRASGASSSAFAATSAATQDAAEPPSPEPSGMPFSSSSSKPMREAKPFAQCDQRLPGGVALRRPAAARPRRCRRRGSRGCARSVRRSAAPVATSRTPSMVCPSRSKPTPMLPTLPGANARAVIKPFMPTCIPL